MVCNRIVALYRISSIPDHYPYVDRSKNRQIALGLIESVRELIEVECGWSAVMC